MSETQAESGVLPKSGIYWGRIMHSRLSPRRHFFTYPIFIFSIDLDEIETHARKLRLFGHNRFSLYTLRDRDHLGDASRPIKENVIGLLRERGYAGPVDKIFMVTQFRALGYLFNPVTFYYCYAEGREVAFVAEVNNTFHQRYSYVFPKDGGSSSFRTDKLFYVSPFVEMDIVYDYRFDALGGKLGVFIDDYKGGQLLLKTNIVGKWTPLSDWGLLKSFLKIPLMSVWIIAWIHWEALKLWLKKVPTMLRPLDGMRPMAEAAAGRSSGQPRHGGSHPHR